MKNIKKYYLLFLSVLVSLSGCAPSDAMVNEFDVAKDTIPPVIILRGKSVDTTFLQISSTTLIANGTTSYTWLPGRSGNYFDPGAHAQDRLDERMMGCMDLSVKTTGLVNNKSLGTYFLHYDTEDAAGNKAATVTRTVCVVENAVSFLNGNYDVACSCTAIAAGVPTPTITKSQYHATVMTSGEINRCFDLNTLNIGSEYLTASAILNGRYIVASGYFLNPVDYHETSAFSGTLSPNGTGFILETEALKWSPSIKYKCKNCYTKIERDHDIN